MPAPLHPPPYAISPAALDAQTRLEYFVAGGPGGQHRNKTETGVRLHHAPSGIIVTATERRSQHENRVIAFERLRERLRKLNVVPKKRHKTKPTRGSKERSVPLTGKAQNTQSANRRPQNRSKQLA